MMIARVLVLSFLTLGLAGCSWFGGDDDKVPLPGERLSVLELQRTLDPKDIAMDSTGFVSPEMWANEFWPQAGGYPTHVLQHVGLRSEPLKKIWSANIGRGAQKNFPLTAQPVVFQGRIFTLDTDNKVSAFDIKTGKRIWRNSVRAKNEGENVISGGLGVGSGLLYVTNGYNEILALNPQSGGIFWRTKLPSPARAAPTILNDRVYVMTVDNALHALNARDGQKIWDYQGLSEVAGLVGAASPAVNGEIVVPAFSSGEIVALRLENGSVAWSDSLAPAVNVGGLSALPDIQAFPIMDKGQIFAISFGGRMAAFDERTGQRIWQKDMNGADTPWLAGNMIFVIAGNNDLTALSRDTGSIAWVTPLDERVREKENRNSLEWNGPILAGGRLIVTGPERLLLEIDPVDGKILRTLKLPAQAALQPIVASNTLFILTTDGDVIAYQ
jgi:outer membrane protein assembly factor BamB